MTSGIYQIRNLINGKVYIGSAVNIKKRWSVHRHRLRKGSHQNRHLQAAWNKYGAESFVFEVLQEIPKEGLLDAEQEHLDRIQKNRRYNFITRVTDGFREYWKSDAARAQQSAKLKAHWNDPEYRKKQAIARKDMYNDSSFREKQSVASKAKWKKEEFRTKFSAAMDAPGRKERRSENARSCWADPEIRAKRIAGVKANWEKRRRKKAR